MSVDLNTVRVEWAYPDVDRYLTDPRGEGGGAGFFVPANAEAYSRDEYKIAALEYTAFTNATTGEAFPGQYTVIDTTGTTGPVVSRFWHYINSNNVTAGSITLDIGRTATSPTVTVAIEGYTAAGVKVNQDGSEIKTVNTTGWSTVTSSINTNTGVVKVRVSITGTGIYAIRRVNRPDQVFDTTYWPIASSQTAPDLATRDMWFDITSKVQAIGIQRGCRPDPPLDQLEIGTATIRFKTLPNNNGHSYTLGSLRPASRVRISGHNGTEWVPVFQGRLDQILTVDALGDEPGYFEWRVTDRVAELAKSNAPSIKGTNVNQRLESVLNSNPSQYTYPAPAIRVRGATNTPFLGSESAAVNSSANMLDHLLTIRNTDKGLLWCDRRNQMQYVSGADAIPAVPNRPTPYIFVTGTPAAGQKSPLLSGWDRDQADEYKVNYLEIQTIDATTSLTERFFDPADVLVYGKRKGGVTVIVPTTTVSGQAIAAGWLYAFNNPSGKALEEFQYNATKDIPVATNVDIYDDVIVAGQTYRIIGLEHVIKPGSWMVRFFIRTKERRLPAGQSYNTYWE